MNDTINIPFDAAMRLRSEVLELRYNKRELERAARLLLAAWDRVMSSDGAAHNMSGCGHFTAAHWANSNGMAGAVARMRDALASEER